jgi:hypothetical protein
MRNRPWRLVLISAVFTIGLSQACSSSGATVTVNEAIFLHEGNSLVSRGAGCSYVRLPASSGGLRGPRLGDFNFSEGPDGDTFVVDVFSDNELLATRRYDEAMLRSGRIDEFTVRTHLGAMYTLRYWGGSCALGVDAGGSPTD